MRRIRGVLIAILIIITSVTAIALYESEQGHIVIKTDEANPVTIREWHIDDKNVTCWSYERMNSRSIALYSGFSCLTDYEINHQGDK